MYAVAARLDPDTYFALARATYREMAPPGSPRVGEFHYLHHRPDGTPYDDPNAMGEALVAAAREAGIRIPLLDTCYLSGGFGAAAARAPRCASPTATPTPGRRGSRALTPAGRDVASARRSTRCARCRATSWHGRRGGAGRPLHVHLSEQVAENDACLRRPRRTPTELLAEAGAARSAHHRRARHPPHRRRHRPARGQPAPPPASAPPPSATSATASGRRRRLHDAGAPLTPRLRQPRRHRPVRGDARASSSTSGSPPASAGTGPPAALLAAATARAREPRLDRRRPIAVGARADLVTLDLHPSAPRGAGADERHGRLRRRRPPTSPTVVVDGRVVVVRAHATRSATRPGPRRGHRRRWMGMAATSSLCSPASASWSPTTRRATARSGCARRRARARGRPRRLVGAGRRRPGRRRARRVGGRAVLPGLRRQPLPSRLRRRPARSSPPGWPDSRTPPAASAPPSRPPAPRPTSELAGHVAAACRRDARAGHHDVEIKSGYGLTVARRGAQPRDRPAFTDETTFLGAHVVPASTRRPDGLRRAGHRRRCSTPARRTPAGSTCSASGGAFDADQARADPRGGAGAGLRGALHANQLGPGRESGSPSSSASPRSTTAPTSTDADVDALRRRRHRRDPAARASSSRPASRTRMPAGCSTPASRVALATDCNPGLVLHLLDAVLHRARGARDGDDPGRGGARRTAGGAALRRDDVGRSPPAAAPTSSSSTRRPTCTSPTAPASPSSARCGSAAVPRTRPSRTEAVGDPRLRHPRAGQDKALPDVPGYLRRRVSSHRRRAEEPTMDSGVHLPLREARPRAPPGPARPPAGRRG